MSEMEQAFASPTHEWSKVSPQLRVMRRAIAIGGCAALFAVALIAAAASGVWLAAAVAAGVLAAATSVAIGVIDRNYRSWGYAERAEDLLVTHGVLFRRLVVVPYGRMQLVDVTAGPVERKFGIATVRLHTASAGTDARIRGLPPDEAARLRDRLAALGEARSAGL
ncbi:MAG TPA: PH domain-containing protein [Acidothermaceae bacterium]|jgi:membrane protein YdbS with pleckstrin-like domain